MKTRPRSAALACLAATLVLASLLPGCGGESEAPPMDAKNIEQLQEKQKQIISREYGPGAGKAGKSK